MTSDARLAELLEEYLASGQSREAFLAAHPGEEVREALLGLDFVGGVAAQRTLGDFRILREIGRGGMGVVYEAEQISLRRRVALKVLPFAGTQLERFRREAQAAAHLHHTHIVPVYAVGSERGVHYYAMQYIDGESLANAIEVRKGGARGGTPLSSHPSHRERGYVRMAATLGMQAALALDHAHGQGIVHRDVKPGNLLVDRAGNLWVTDFGLAHFAREQSLTATGDLLGTLRYMSPEQALGPRAPLDHRSDIYSLGVTLYELLTLEPAVRGDEPQQILREIAEGDLAHSPVPPELETILLKATWKEPSGRYATAAEMAEDLRRFLDDLPVLARRPTLLDRASKWARRHRSLVATGAAALLLLLIGLAASTLLILKEKGKTEANYKEALVQRGEAEKNLKVARDAVEEMLARVGDEGLRDVPMLESLRRELLRKAAEFYRGLLDRHGDDPDLQHDVAMVSCQLGHIQQLLGEMEPARAALDESVTRLERLAVGRPRYRDSLARALRQRGAFAFAAGRIEEAEADFRRALDLWEALPDDAALTPSCRESIADTYRQLCVVLDRRGDRPGAERAAREALVRFDRLLAEVPSDTCKAGKASALNNLAGALLARGLREESLALFEGASALTDELLAAQPYSSTHRGACASHNHNIGMMLSELGRSAEAIPRLARSIEVGNELVRDFPSIPRHRQVLGDCHLMFAQCLLEGGDTVAAEQHAREAVRILDGLHEATAFDRSSASDAAGAHGTLARVLAATGRHSDAAEEGSIGVKVMRGLVGTDLRFGDRVLLAHALGQCANQLGAAGRLEEADAHFREAIALFDALAVESKEAGLQVSRCGSLVDFGGFLADSGRPGEGEKVLLEAVRGLEVLAGSASGDFNARQFLARAYVSLAAIAQACGRGADRLRCLRAARAGFAALAGEFPGMARHSGAEADCLVLLGEHLLKSGERADALEACQAAVAIYERLRAHSLSAEVKSGFAAALRQLGEALLAAAHWTGAEEAFRRAIELQRDVAGNRKSRADERALANSLGSLGGLLFNVEPRRGPESEAVFREVLALREELARGTPAAPGDLSELGAALHNLASSLLVQDRGEGTVELFERAIELQRAAIRGNGQNPDYRRLLGTSCLAVARQSIRLGDHARAARAAAGLAEAQPDDALANREAGRGLILATQAAARDDRLDVAERARVRRAYAEQAVPLLERAVALGPGDALAWVLLGFARLETEALESAIEAVAKACALNPGNKEYEWFLLSIAHARLGHDSEARIWYDRAVAGGVAESSRDVQREAARLLGIG